MAPVFLELGYQGPWWCPMCGPGGTWGWGMVIMMLFWAVVLAVVIWLIVQLVARGHPPGAETGQSRAEEIVR